MNYQIFHFIHLSSVFLLVGSSVYAIAVARKQDKSSRKKLLIYSGVASLFVILTGFGLLGYLSVGVPAWSLVKIGVWLLLSGIVGLAFRFSEKSSLFIILTAALVLLAIAMVAFKPF